MTALSMTQIQGQWIYLRRVHLLLCPEMAAKEISIAVSLSLLVDYHFNLLC